MDCTPLSGGVGWLGLRAIVLCFVVPFAALSGERPKTNPAWLGGIALLVLAGLWLERNLLISL